MYGNTTIRRPIILSDYNDVRRQMISHPGLMIPVVLHTANQVTIAIITYSSSNKFTLNGGCDDVVFGVQTSNSSKVKLSSLVLPIVVIQYE